VSPVALALVAPREVRLIEEARKPLASDEVRIRTLFSGVSAGTELASYRGSSPFLRKQWDPQMRLFVTADRPATEYPLTTWGYEEVGEVVELGSGVDGIPLGARVFGTWGHRSEHVAPAAFARDRLLPSDANPLIGTFSHIGAIALNGVLDTRVHLGETVAVFGLGVVGQLVCQLLTHSGARLIALDLLAARRAMAVDLGATIALDPSEGDLAVRIKQLTAGRGADVCVEASGAASALQAAIRAAAYASRVVALGFYQGEASGLFLGEEFHHNRIEVVCSQIGGIAPELQHRWDRSRLVRTFLELAVQGAVHVTDLVTHRVPIREAAELYRLLDESPSAVMQSVLEFP
jgi:2-desacetyl-2-hydroxyethyl bacteriochlorophyllide A dehydrogenase